MGTSPYKERGFKICRGDPCGLPKNGREQAPPLRKTVWNVTKWFKSSTVQEIKKASSRWQGAKSLKKLQATG